MSGALNQFLENGGKIIGICNGFQVLCQVGMFGDVTLARNRQGVFVDRWVEMDFVHQDSVWLNNLKGESIVLPIRHGEGRLILGEKPRFKPALKYRSDVNGSHEQIAGIVDDSGQVFGLMPHSEAALDAWLYPLKNSKQNIEIVSKILK